MKNKLRKAISMLLFCTVFLSALFQTKVYAQQQRITITGTVTESKGETLIGASVMVKGTNLGTITDIDGKYKLSVSKDATTLIISYIGMKTKEVAIKGNVVNVVLEDNSTVMNELVVIGYGTIAKKDLTGAVSTVKGDVLSQIPITNISSALTGRLAGVQITTTDGQLDADVKIRIRGGGSITQDNSPLYIVDGFPVDNLKDIPPTDIESVDVLKDASSTAIYGARGANGVIIVTTKGAKEGRTTVSYNGYVQQKHIPKLLDVMNPYEYVLWQYELTSMRGEPYAGYFKDSYGIYDDLDIYKNIRGTNYQDALFGANLLSHYHNLNVTGGTAKTKFALSYTYNNDEGYAPGSGVRSHNINLKLNHELFKGLRFDMTARYNNINLVGAGNTSMRSAVVYRPVKGKTTLNETKYTNPDDEMEDAVAARSSLYDPVTLSQQEYQNEVRQTIEVNGALSWDITKNLTLRSEYGLRSTPSELDRFYGPLTGTARSNGNLPMITIRHTDGLRWRNANTLQYNAKIKKDHSINALAGFELMSESSDYIESVAKKFPRDISKETAFAIATLGSQEYTTTKDNGDTRLESFFGRVNYSYLGKYLLTGTLRADGSTKFSPKNRWGFFPSAAAAWRISDETFMNDLNWLSNLKLRFSYGEAGNNRISNDMWRRTYVAGNVTTSPAIGFGGIPAAYYVVGSSVLINEDLKWETTITRNFGLDFGFFDNKLSGSLELYQNTTKDLLLQAPIPSLTGYSTQLINIGQTTNRGIELTLDAVILQGKDYGLYATFNISANKNRVDKLNGVKSSFFRSNWASTTLKDQDDYLLAVGQSIGLMYGYVTDGFYTMDDFTHDGTGYVLNDGVANDYTVTSSLYGYGNRNPAPGSLKLKDLTDDGDNNIKSADRTVIGNATPKHSGGFSLSGNYKGIDASVFLNWVYGNDIYNANKISFTTWANYEYYNMLSIVDSKNRFRYYDDNGKRVFSSEGLAELNKNATIWNPGMQSPVFHSWAVEDGSFLRLSNLTLGYTLPASLINKLGMSKFRVYVTGYNLWLWTKYTGYDPEVDAIRSTPLTPGVDWNAFPKSRTYTVGLNITF